MLAGYLPRKFRLGLARCFVMSVSLAKVPGIALTMLSAMPDRSGFYTEAQWVSARLSRLRFRGQALRLCCLDSSAHRSWYPAGLTGTQAK